ncbi:unnamed protein product, partial [Mesorhabditis belari]|uniref:Uncharacterized protein n=1 Tax=Mesorhabditis belari TaxID=2138241 RepID=A0AAF3J8E4_9BILA
MERRKRKEDDDQNPLKNRQLSTEPKKRDFAKVVSEFNGVGKTFVPDGLIAGNPDDLSIKNKPPFDPVVFLLCALAIVVFMISIYMIISLDDI